MNFVGQSSTFNYAITFTVFWNIFERSDRGCIFSQAKPISAENKVNSKTIEKLHPNCKRA